MTVEAKLNPRHFTHCQDYVAAELARINQAHREMQPAWRRRPMPAGRTVANMCVDWVRRWDDAHYRVPTG